MSEQEQDEFQWALQNGDDDLVKSILDKDKSLAEKELNGRPPLCIAADYGQTSAVKVLLKRGANINQADKHGITPLLSAIFENHTKCVQILLEKGADKDGKGPGGESYTECAESEEMRNLLK